MITSSSGWGNLNQPFGASAYLVSGPDDFLSMPTPSASVRNGQSLNSWIDYWWCIDFVFPVTSSALEGKSLERLCES